jgi:predicted DNA-binding transcriptional regulator AlpA
MYQTNTINNYPIILTAKEVAEILQISKPLAYQLMKGEDFPLIQEMGRTKRVMRDRFFEWIQTKSS